MKLFQIAVLKIVENSYSRPQTATMSFSEISDLLFLDNPQNIVQIASSFEKYTSTYQVYKRCCFFAVIKQIVCFSVFLWHVM